jgi:hypothetical protein
VRLADDALLRQRLGSQARDFAARHFMGWEEKVQREIELMEKLMAAQDGEGS